MKTTLLLLCLAASACETARATERPVPRALATDCVANCNALDMRMTAVVIIMSSAGCVCEPKQTTAMPPTAGTAAAAGGAVIQATLEAQRQAQAQQQQQQQHSSPH